MNQLSQLVGVQLPPPVSWWPLAVGWYYLACLVIVMLSYYAYKKRCHYLQQAYRRQAILAITILTPADAAALLPIIKAVLQSSVTLYNGSKPKQQINDALVTEEDWFALFSRTGEATAFNEDNWALLMSMTYQAPSVMVGKEARFEALKTQCLHWVKDHQL